jgi:WD40 repeat protein
MGRRTLLALLPLAVLAWVCAPTEAAPVATGETDPVLHLEGGGPLAPVSAVAFGRDGNSLYEAGWDKVVRVWRHDPQTGRFRLDADATMRIPIGPGDAGVLNALDVSADGHWLAAGGNAVFPGGAGFREFGLIVPRATVADPLAQGVIYVFDLRSNPPRCRPLRGHRGYVQALAFATPAPGRPTVLLSAAAEMIPEQPGAPWVVLRLWDLDSGKELARVVAGKFQRYLPRLAGWPVAPEPTGYRVATAWTDESLLVWDVGAPAPRRLADPYQGRSFVLSQERNPARLLTGHFGRPVQGGRDPEGYLASWDAGASRITASKTLSWQGEAPNPGGVKAMPVAQALVPPRPGAPNSLLAVVLQAWSRADRADSPGAYQLQLIDVEPDHFGDLRAAVSLWQGPRRQPFLAAAPDGARLAVVGNPENEILVHDVATLLKNQGRPEAQRLSGDGQPIEAVSFVRNGPEQWGLRIERTGRAPLVLDIANRRWAPGLDGWVPAVAPVGDWTIELDRQEGQPLTLRIAERGKGVGPGIRLVPEGRSSAIADVELTARALLPARRGPARDPLAAVALFEPDVGPELWLYHVPTGERVRRLSAHTGRIRSLAFSDDGRFLLSTAADRTACLWSLEDLDRIVGTRGALPGLVLGRRPDGSCVVQEIAADSPYRGRADLRAGDVIAGVVVGQPDQLRRLDAPADLYVAAAARKPGETLILRRLRAGAATRDLALVLGQAADQRNPRASIFLAKGDEWLAWDPLGPYDSSGDAVATQFGWHFNQPDQPESPARFAMASDPAYQRFRREGLLRDLLRIEPPPPPLPPRIEESDLKLFVEPEDPAGGFLRQPPTRLSLVLNSRIDASRVAIESVRWQLDDRPAKEMAPDGPDWSADLSPIAWDRAPHHLRVTVQTAGVAAQTVETSKRFRYIPPPPGVALRAPDGRGALSPTGLDVDDRNLRLKAEITPAPNQAAQARLIHRHADIVVREADFGPDFAAKPLDLTLVLKPGANTIELVAVNDGAAADLSRLETAQLPPLKINYRPRPVDPPSIQLDSLVLLNDEPGTEPQTMRVLGSGPVVVTVPRLRLDGLITAKDKLLNVAWKRSGKDWTVAEGFTPRLAERLDLHQELELEPGRSTIQLRAAAGNDDSPEATGELALVVEYRPPLPRLEDLALEPRGPIVMPGTAGDPPRVKLTARIVGTPERFPLEGAVVLAGDERQAGPVTIERQPGVREGLLTALVPIRPGTTPIGIRYWNRGDQGHSWTRPVTVTCLRPPLVASLEARVLEGRAFAAIAARVQSLSPPTRVEIRVLRPQGGEWATRSFDPSWVHQEEAWVVAREVPVEPGESTVLVRAWNEDGESPQASTRLEYKPPPPPPPVAIVETPEKAVVDRPIVSLRFLVRSTSPLHGVTLYRNPVSAPRETIHEFKATAARRHADGTHELSGADATFEIPLLPGENAFQLVATNDGGETSSNLVFTYTPPPVRVLIDAIATRTKSGADLRVVPTPRSDGPPLVSEVLPHGTVALEGRVVWSDENSLRVYNDPRIQVWVNGFPQVAARLGPIERRLERAFRADLILSSQENQIVVRLGGAPLDIHGDRRLGVACREPERGRRLHLWIIGMEMDDADTLRERAIAALNGRDYNREFETFKTPAFATAKVYGPDCKDLDEKRMFGQLSRIRTNIRLSSVPSNDVVLIFYHGGEVIDAQGGRQEPCLRLRPSDASPGGADLFPLSEIRRGLGGTRGAKLFVLDVTHAPDQALLILAQSFQWIREDSPYGLLRFSWPRLPELTDASAGVVPAALKTAVERSVTLEQVRAEVDRQLPTLLRQHPGLQQGFELDVPRAFAPQRDEFTRAFNMLVVGGP